MSRDDATLLDILRAARLALELRGPVDRTTFLGDLKTQAAAGLASRLVGAGLARPRVRVCQRPSVSR